MKRIKLLISSVLADAFIEGRQGESMDAGEAEEEADAEEETAE